MQKSLLGGMVIVALLAGAASGYAVGKAGGGGVGLSMPERERAFKEGYDKARNDINEIFVAKGLSYPLDHQITDVFGRVVEVGGGGFVMEYDSSQFTVLDQGMVRKSVMFADGAQLLKMVDAPKGSPEDAAADLAPRGSTGALEVVPPADSSQPLPKEKAPPAPPEAPESVQQIALDITSADIKVGDYVHVKTGGNAQSDGSLLASEVTVLNVKIEPGSTPKVTDLPFSRSYGTANNGDSGPPEAPAP
jgi:hypothetical protein